jgi:hypothetical protein
MVRGVKSIVKRAHQNDIARNPLIQKGIEGRTMYLNPIVFHVAGMKALGHCFPPKLSV